MTRERGNGSVFARGNKLWLRFRKKDGERVRTPTDFVVGQEQLAEETLRLTMDAIDAESEPIDAAKSTVAQYATQWIKKRIAAGITSAHDNKILLGIACRKIGEQRIAAVTRADIVAMMSWLKTTPSRFGKPYSARTQRHVYFTLSTMFDDAVIDGLLAASPCQLKTRRGEIPAARDRDPLWRRQAVYTIEEIAKLVSDPRLSVMQRAISACQALAGLRYGEVAALRWEVIDLDAEHMGRMTVHRSFNSNQLTEGSTKTDAPREIPIHSALAALFHEWSFEWTERVGREPKPDDLVFPNYVKRRKLGWTYRTKKVGLDEHIKAEKLLGLRHRRQHDMRRTFISIVRSAGADTTLLKWITHGPSRSVIDSYTTPQWEALCRQVELLKLPEAAVPNIRAHYGHSGLILKEKMAPTPGLEPGTL